MEKIDISLDELPYEIEEAMNRLRINLKFSSTKTRKILITSSVPNEGKSTVAIYLWKLMAEAGFPSVYVDLDLRKSVFKARYRRDFNEIKDVTQYISGLASEKDILYETNIENGYIVPVENLLENPSSLLEDDRLANLLDKLSEDYRYIIIDSPPLENVADAVALAQHCDGALLIIRAASTPKKLIRHAMQQLQRAECPIIGTVLNRAPSRGSADYRYYHY